MTYEVSIEITDGEFAAWLWFDRHGSQVLETAFWYGATDWRRVDRDWGVVIEFEFPDQAAWARCRLDPVFDATLQQAPDPVNGVHIHPGWGGSTGAREPRRPRPFAGAGAVALPLEEEAPFEPLTPIVIGPENVRVNSA